MCNADRRLQNRQQHSNGCRENERHMYYFRAPVQAILDLQRTRGLYPMFSAYAPTLAEASVQIQVLLQDSCATGDQDVLLTPAMTATCMCTCDVTHPAMVPEAQGTSPMRQHSQSMRRASVATWALPQACCRHCSSRAGDSRLTAGTGFSSFPSRLDIRIGCCAASMLSAQCCMEHTHGAFSCHTHPCLGCKDSVPACMLPHTSSVGTQMLKARRTYAKTSHWAMSRH